MRNFGVMLEMETFPYKHLPSKIMHFIMLELVPTLARKCSIFCTFS
jgi:hypothetical protein